MLGGFLAALFAVDPEHLKSKIAARAYGGVEIRPLGLGSNLLLIGTAELVFENLLKDPAKMRESKLPTSDLA